MTGTTWEGKRSRQDMVDRRVPSVTSFQVETGFRKRGLGDAPRTPLEELTQHASCRSGRKSSVHAVPGHRSGV
ncbi:hypothetical protein [Leptospirillum ferriphilum]|uniref:hypothetical protein n=1 Tax=Leptospirillum ferriphilum TaxID=178606 RepID=UPI0012378B79|nr:hypothetical protein [Leptospirillum ferriphilum]